MTNPLLSDFWPGPSTPPSTGPNKPPWRNRAGLALTIAYVTCRVRPRFDWFVNSLAREIRSVPGLQSENLQIVVVDSRLWYDDNRGKEFAAIAEGKIAFEHRPPKPSAWQGPQRQTSVDYFCAVNARNSAIAYARAEHIAFADDVGVLRPGWLKAHLDAVDGHYALVGTTCKVRDLAVADDGHIQHFKMTTGGEDTRIAQIHEPVQRCTGLWLYGGTFSVPMHFVLAVNGKDEAYMGINGADYDFGLRLERAGCPFYASKSCGRYEGKEIEPGVVVEPRAAHCNKPWKGPDGPLVNNYLINDLKRTTRSWTRGNDYNLKEVRKRVLALGETGFPPVKPNQRHWVDKQPLAEM
jgi:hypothetical protein